jgi:uncharacterized protein YggE
MTRRPYGLALLALLALPGAALRAQATPPSADGPPEVETVGFGERRVAPDRAVVMLFVESRAASAAAAAAANARAVAAVRDTLRRLGLDSAATTAGYNVGPDYEPPRPSPRAEGPQRRGYVARTTVRVQLSQLDQVGRAIDAGLARGGSGVEGVFFEASTAEEVRRAALAEAAAAARRDAEALARALGGTLGPLVSVSTSGGGGMDPRRMIQMRGGGVGAALQSTAIVPNELVVTAAVVTRWRFLPGTPGR